MWSILHPHLATPYLVKWQAILVLFFLNFGSDIEAFHRTDWLTPKSYAGPLRSSPIIYNMHLNLQRHSTQAFMAMNSDLKYLDWTLLYFLLNKITRSQLACSVILFTHLLVTASAMLLASTLALLTNPHPLDCSVLEESSFLYYAKMTKLSRSPTFPLECALMNYRITLIEFRFFIVMLLQMRKHI